MSISRSARRDRHGQAEAAVTEAGGGFPSLPTETEIYILPDGRVVIADLPAELAGLAAVLGEIERDETLTSHHEQ